MEEIQCYSLLIYIYILKNRRLGLLQYMVQVVYTRNNQAKPKLTVTKHASDALASSGVWSASSSCSSSPAYESGSWLDHSSF